MNNKQEDTIPETAAYSAYKINLILILSSLVLCFMTVFVTVFTPKMEFMDLVLQVLGYGMVLNVLSTICSTTSYIIKEKKEKM